MDPATQMGPLVSDEQFRRVSGSLDSGSAVANDSSYALGAGIWTRNISKAHALAKELRTGTVWINCYQDSG
jgi:phenylacetaldehyde dehydrogenase